MPDHLLRSLHGHSSAVNAVRLTHDGLYCMTASDDRTVKLWNPHKSVPDTDQALCVHSFEGVHGYAITDVAITLDKSRFATAGQDKACFLWDVASSRVIRRVQAHDQRTNAIAFNKQATVLFTASYDKTVKCWDLRSQSREPIQSLAHFTDSVTSLSVGVESSLIVAGSVDGSVRLYDMRSGCMHTDDMADPVTCVRLSEDEQTYLATCLGGSLKLMDIAQGKVLKEYTGHRHEQFKTEAAFCYTAGSGGSSSSSGNKKSQPQSCRHQIIGGSEDGAIFHWDLLTGQVVDTTSHVHRKAISSVTVHPTQDMFLTASYDGAVKCWSTSGGAQPRIGNF